MINSFLQDDVEIRKDCVLSHCRITVSEYTIRALDFCNMLEKTAWYSCIFIFQGSVSVGQGCILTGISPEDISPTNGYNNVSCIQLLPQKGHV